MNTYLLQLLLREVEVQCDFALMAWDDAEKALEREDGDRIWYSIQSFLVAAANLSKLLWPRGSSLPGRGSSLRQSLAVGEDSPLESKTLRNCFEHFDERLETWARAHPDGPFIDRNIVLGGAFAVIPQDAALRNLEGATWTVIFRGERYCLPPIATAVRILRDRARFETEEIWNESRARDS